MPRQARLKSCRGEYHVMMRGINHQRIFDSDDDCRKFIQIIHSLKQRPGENNKDSDWMILAYALMTNHFHILVKEGNISVGDFVKKIAGAYVLYYNRKNRRDGHLFKERFKSEPCEDDDYFITLLRYIHQNPVKARMVNDVADYEFTSWHEFADAENCQYPICNTQYVLERIDLPQLKELIYTPLSDKVKCIEISESNDNEIRLTEEEAEEMFRHTTGCANSTMFHNLKRDIRDGFIRELKQKGVGTKQLSRISGFGIATIVKACKQLSAEEVADKEK